MTPLGELIAERIRGGGPISFAEFMELSLYHPALGYYARDARKTGRAGDFFTSVDVGREFGELLAKQFAEFWSIVDGPRSTVENPKPKAEGPFDLVEAAAGNGRLMRDVLDAAQRNHPDFYRNVRVSLVEASPAARSAQRETLGPHAPLLAHADAALPSLISGIHGAVFANELLDALPTHAVAMTADGLREVFVDCRDGRFTESLEKPSTPRIAEYLERAGATLQPGWRAEVNLAAEDWVRAAASAIERGFLLLIDYGHEERELYSAAHASGTLTTFKQHTTERDWQEPGTFDITAHVDLSAVRRAAEMGGMQLLGAMDQTYFMLGLGLEEVMSAPQGFDAASLQRRLALKTLLLPGGLGSTHKVMIFGKGVDTPALKALSYRSRLT